MEQLIISWLQDPTIRKFISAIAGLLVIGVFVNLLKKYLTHYIKDSDNRYRARKFISFIGYLVGIIFIAAIFSGQLRNLTIAFGVAGAGVAFALQEVIASIAGWVVVSIGNFYKTGDRIQLGGITGDVIDIGVLRTTLMECREWVASDQYNGRIVRVANSFVFKEPVFNYSADFPFLWDEISVPVKHGCDHRMARELFNRVVNEAVGEYVAHARNAWEEVVKKYMIEDARIEPMVFLTVNDNWMEFTVRYVVDYKKRRIIKDRLFTRILEEIEKTEGRIAIASTTLHVVQTPALDVRLINNRGEQKG